MAWPVLELWPDGLTRSADLRNGMEQNALTPRVCAVYSPTFVCHDGTMKISKEPGSLTVDVPPLRQSEPIPYTADPEEVRGSYIYYPIEPPPPAIRRTLKAKLNRRGPSRPIPVIDPWE